MLMIVNFIRATIANCAFCKYIFKFLSEKYGKTFPMEYPEFIKKNLQLEFHFDFIIAQRSKLVRSFILQFRELKKIVSTTYSRIF